MKTPREILLERHREQSPALDDIRARVIAREVSAARPDVLAAVRAWLTLRRTVWGAFTAAWCAIVALNVAARHDLTATPAPASADSNQALAGVREYRAQLALLLNDPLPGEDSDSNHSPPASRPRSDAGRLRKDAFNFTREFA